MKHGEKMPDPTSATLQGFAHWLSNNSTLAGADMVYRRYLNADDQNLTGHVKQSFAACYRFLSARPDLRRRLSAQLDRMRPNQIYNVSTPGVLDAWLDHMQAHLNDRGSHYDYSILSSYLPPSLGGHREGGGGGSSTFKRMLPLVARYIEERGK
jgi:hypothetical protein